MTRTMARNPAVLRGWMELNSALSKTLTRALSEQIAIAVAEDNGCGYCYCLSAHTAMGGMVGVPEAGLAASREGASSDPFIGASRLKCASPSREMTKQVSRAADEVDAPVRIGIAIFEGAEELDFVGPWEVLAAWRFLYPDDVEVFLVGEDGAPVTCAKGLRVLPDKSWPHAGDFDVLVYPGGRGTRPQLGNEQIRARLRRLRERGTLMTSVCTGSLVYADAGLLDGQPATTYWSAFDELLPLGQGIMPRPDARFVDVGDVITAAGVSAGIDMALHLVGRLGSPDKAREVRRYIQYDPEPPY